MPEWGDFLLTERGTDRDREVAGGIQYEAAAFVARLQAASTSGPQPSGCTKRKFSGPGCDVNSLIRAGTKTRASQVHSEHFLQWFANRARQRSTLPQERHG